MKRSKTLMLCGAVVVGSWLALPAKAGNMDAILDSTNGSSSFVVSDSGTNALAKVRSDGAVAGGRRASASHSGTFVWADSAAAAFSSTGTNQFLIRAGGGVGINTNAPQAALHVSGDAVIGSLANAPRFGMQAVATTGSGVLFRHPAADVSLIWDHTLDHSWYFLTVSNGLAATQSYDVHLLMSKDADFGTSRSALGYARDLFGSDSTLTVSNAMNQSAGYTITVIRENAKAPGFTFQGTCWDTYISGLVIFWY